MDKADDAARVIRGIEASNNAIKYVFATRVPAGSLHDLGSELTGAVTAELPIATILNKVAHSDDPYGQAIASSVCYGLSQVAAMDPETETTSPERWDAFLIEQVNVLLPTNPIALIEAAVKRFTTTAELSQIHPGLARTYFQECHKA